MIPDWWTFFGFATGCAFVISWFEDEGTSPYSVLCSFLIFSFVFVAWPVFWAKGGLTRLGVLS